jgi:hypothetical protein
MTSKVLLMVNPTLALLALHMGSTVSSLSLAIENKINVFFPPAGFSAFFGV